MLLDDGETGGSVFILPDTLFQGAAGLGKTKVLARRAFNQEGKRPSTLFHVVNEEGCWEAEILGRWRLYDAHPDGLVLETPDPYPRVQVVNWEWFAGVLSKARCRSSSGKVTIRSFQGGSHAGALGSGQGGFTEVG